MDSRGGIIRENSPPLSGGGKKKQSSREADIFY